MIGAYGNPPAIQAGDIYGAANAGLSTIGLVSSGFSLTQAARQNVSQVPVPTPQGNVLLGAGYLGIGLVIAFGLAYVLDKHVLPA